MIQFIASIVVALLVVGMTGNTNAQEIAKWGKVVREAGLKAE